MDTPAFACAGMHMTVCASNLPQHARIRAYAHQRSTARTHRHPHTHGRGTYAPNTHATHTLIHARTHAHTHTHARTRTRTRTRTHTLTSVSIEASPNPYPACSYCDRFDGLGGQQIAERRPRWVRESRGYRCRAFFRACDTFSVLI